MIRKYSYSLSVRYTRYIFSAVRYQVNEKNILVLNMSLFLSALYIIQPSVNQLNSTVILRQRLKNFINHSDDLLFIDFYRPHKNPVQGVLIVHSTSRHPIIELPCNNSALTLKSPWNILNFDKMAKLDKLFLK